jgi:squalene-hopene/tetraprenyl-beta-curcumene cyclase
MSQTHSNHSTTALEQLNLQRLNEAFLSVRKELLDQRGTAPHWTGQLSTSALSTATAISALSLIRKQSVGSDSPLTPLISRAAQWLYHHQNPDGGFGDTDRSHSNIATTLLVIAAWKLCEFESHSNLDVSQALSKAWSYVDRQGRWEGLRRRYGKDKTFVVPILSNCALAGLVPWSEVPALPFELAALPQAWYRFVKMPVVSYAIPALVAIGQAKHYHAPTKFLPWRWVRSSCVQSSRRVLQKMQPQSGGYLEAVPLTSFVLMSLASMGCHNHPVAQEAIRFLVEGVLEDGSWPIDTNLATWVTSLSIKSLSRAHLDTSIDDATIRWLLSCQHRTRHPFTGADPGGWGWTNLSGAVPDADDTPAALLALHAYWTEKDAINPDLRAAILEAVTHGIGWLYGLQNRDGGWPTFCRGWGTLPFDRSGTDLTAHAMRAIDVWLSQTNDQDRLLPKDLFSKKSAAFRRGLNYLERKQNSDGSWLPLWFGNQDYSGEDNPIYGTSRVLLALNELKVPKNLPQIREMRRKGSDFLRKHQNRDGGWGGGPSVPYGMDRQLSQCGSVSSVEESAVALEALLTLEDTTLDDSTIIRGLNWLSESICLGYHRTSWPIGFYFAKLWYYEKLYPTIFSTAALSVAYSTAHRIAVKGP